MNNFLACVCLIPIEIYFFTFSNTTGSSFSILLSTAVLFLAIVRWLGNSLAPGVALMILIFAIEAVYLSQPYRWENSLWSFILCAQLCICLLQWFDLGRPEKCPAKFNINHPYFQTSKDTVFYGYFILTALLLNGDAFILEYFEHHSLLIAVGCCANLFAFKWKATPDKSALLKRRFFRWHTNIFTVILFLLPIVLLAISFHRPVSRAIPKAVSPFKTHGQSAFGQRERPGADSDSRSTVTTSDPSTAQKKDSAIGFNDDELKLPNQLKLNKGNRVDLVLRMSKDSISKALSFGHLYLRGKTYSVFDHDRFVSNKDKEEWIFDLDDGKQDQKIGLGSFEGTTIHYQILVNNPDLETIFACPQMTEIQANRIMSLGEDRYRIQKPEGALYRYFASSSYTPFEQLDPSVEISSVPIIYYRSEQQKFLNGKIKTLANEITASAESSFEKVMQIKAFLRQSYRYTTSFKHSRHLHPLINFLFHEKKGHCVLFASSFCLLLRSCNIPARVASGFLAKEYHQDTKSFIVRSDHAHAWTEVYVKNKGWLVVDATAQLQPTLQEFLSSRLSTKDSFELGIDDDLPTLIDLDQQSKGWRSLKWETQMLLLSLMIFSLSFTVMCIHHFNSGKWTLRSKHPDVSSFHEFPFYQLLLAKLAPMGPVAVSQTPKEYIWELKRKDLISNDVDEMVDYMYRVCYHEEKRDRLLERSFKRQLRKINLS